MRWGWRDWSEQPRTSDRGLIVAVIAAHNEHDCIGQAIRSLDEQSSRPDITIVCAYNCLDRTALAVQAEGADALVAAGSEHGRAGALNDVLDLLLPQLRDDDAVLIMDAESFPGPGFVAEARRRLTDGVGGVGGVHRARGRRLRRAVQRGPTTARSSATWCGRARKNWFCRHRGAVFRPDAVARRHGPFRRPAADGRLSGLQRRPPGRDAELALTLIYLGYKVVAVP